MYERSHRNESLNFDEERCLCQRDVSLFGTKQQLYQSYRKQESVAFSGMLFCICDYFGITPREFFDEATPLPGTQRYHRGFEILGRGNFWPRGCPCQCFKKEIAVNNDLFHGWNKSFSVYGRQSTDVDDFYCSFRVLLYELDVSRRVSSYHDGI